MQHNLALLLHKKKKMNIATLPTFGQEEPVRLQAYICYHVVSAHCNVINDLIPDN